MLPDRLDGNGGSDGGTPTDRAAIEAHRQRRGDHDDAERPRGAPAHLSGDRLAGGQRPLAQDQSAYGTAAQFDADADALAAGAEGGLSGWLSWTRPRRHQRPFGLGFGRDAWLIVCEVHAGGTWALRFRADSSAPWVPLSVTLGTLHTFIVGTA